MPLSLQIAVARKLLRLADGSVAGRHFAYGLAGLAAWVGLLPPVVVRRSLTLRECAGGVLILASLFMFVGHILRWLAPALHWVGARPGWVPLLAVAVLVLAWRYWVGRRVLRALAEMAAAQSRVEVAAYQSGGLVDLPNLALVPYAVTPIARAARQLFATIA